MCVLCVTYIPKVQRSLDFQHNSCSAHAALQLLRTMYVYILYVVLHAYMCIHVHFVVLHYYILQASMYTYIQTHVCIYVVYK